MSIYWPIPCYDGIRTQEFKPDLTRSVTVKKVNFFQKLHTNITLAIY